jgi:hypothetical protein
MRIGMTFPTKRIWMFCAPCITPQRLGDLVPILVPIAPFLGKRARFTSRQKYKTDKGWSSIAPGRVELPTSGLGNRCSIRLSYGAAAFDFNKLQKISGRKMASYLNTHLALGSD